MHSCVFIDRCLSQTLKAVFFHVFTSDYGALYGPRTYSVQGPYCIHPEHLGTE